MDRITFLEKKKKTEAISQYLFKGEKMEIYIPAKYFDPSTGLAKIVGDKIESLGSYLFKVFADNKSDNGVLYSINLPVEIQFGYSSVRNETIKITKDLKEEPFRIFTLNKGDIFLNEDVYIKSGKTVYEFISRLVHGGKMPTTMKYTESLSMYLNSLGLHDIGLGVPSVIIELILSEMYRYGKDTTKPFRMKYKSDKPYDYKMIRIQKIPEMTSTFTGIASDDINHKIAVGVLRKKEGKKDIESPIEKVLKY